MSKKCNDKIYFDLSEEQIKIEIENYNIWLKNNLGKYSQYDINKTIWLARSSLDRNKYV